MNYTAIAAALYAALNIFVFLGMTPHEMKTIFFDEMNFIGKIMSFIFYAPAWGLKFAEACVKAAFAS